MSGDNDNVNMVKLSVPGTLTYRDVVLRAVASICRLARLSREQETSHFMQVANFDDKIVSAVGEAFNNIALHGYSGAPGDVDLELEFDDDALTIRLFDTGKGFDPQNEPELDLASLPESHMGLFIVNECMDEVVYRRGVSPMPNVLILTKRYVQGDEASVRATGDD